MPSAQIVEHDVCSFGIFSIFHDADAARTVNAEPGMVAVVGHRDAALDRGLQDGLALLDGDLTTIDRQRDGVHNNAIISKRGDDPRKTPHLIGRKTMIEACPRTGPTCGDRACQGAFDTSAIIPSSRLISTDRSGPSSATRLSTV